MFAGLAAIFAAFQLQLSAPVTESLQTDLLLTVDLLLTF